MAHLAPDWRDRFSLQGRKAFVTGASKGIGFTICEVFAQAGTDIVAVARDEEGLGKVARAIKGQGRRCLTIRADMGDAEDAVAAARRALAEWGTIDILVNNAGITRLAPATDLTLGQWEEVMAVNLRAPFLLARELAPAMIEQRWGKVVMISSQTGVIALEDHAAYATSKGGLNALTKSLAAEWAPHGVRVNALAPGYVKTEMAPVDDPRFKPRWIDDAPMQRYAVPEELGPSLVYLASDASSFMTGSVLVVDGGYTLW